ncbi:MAG: Outer membrane protein beta-barrel domain [Phormidesmis priestleyi Ana]|uniref:Outer membrane protein beta-barrel domain n=1 Tax=Phormidesmis priestleyi Ana TaxID=1666911 RepID=A0A0P8BSW0_9CYAN|nr:MAG: Outer membrane protein beta-barrel domain [Phormidesmis priestleyi Ana]
MKKHVLGAMTLALLALGIQLPTRAQTTVPLETVPIEAASWTQSENLTAESLAQPNADTLPGQPESSALVYPVTDSLSTDSSIETPIEAAPTELAQARRRTSASVGGSDFIGIGGDFGYADDLSFAVISKLSLSENVALRPSVLVGDDLSVLVPVTYEFNRYSTDVGGFRVLPYAGVGASYQDNSDNENFNLLLSAGADVPLSDQFTLNAQANVGVLNDTEFGVTVGVGYNFGRLIR